MSVSVPNRRKKSDTIAIKIFFPHQRHEPMELISSITFEQDTHVRIYCQAPSGPLQVLISIT